MSIYHSGFDSIVSGQQRIEVRVNDLRRQQIKMGDTIILTRKPEEDESLQLEVIGLSYFRTFKDLFESLPAELFGWPLGITIEEQVLGMHKYYTKPEEEQFGVVAIHIRLIARKLLAGASPNLSE